ncbi:MAG: hypothetical protein V1861_02120, partial [Candidatus Micrarchaeota archaeon]
FKRRSKPPASDPAPTTEVPADSSIRDTLPSQCLPPAFDTTGPGIPYAYVSADELPPAEVVTVITSSGSIRAAQPDPVVGIADKAVVSEALSAEELRKTNLKGVRVTKGIMYRLICVECFRLATSKAIIGNSYKPLAVVQSNLARKLNGDKELSGLFYRCWTDMVRSQAIDLRKCGTVASINPHPDAILNADIRAAVKWAFSEHRRVLGASPIAQTRTGST